MPKKDDKPARPDRLSRDDMVKVIERGGTVLHEGRLYSKVEHLPSEAELAGDDPVKKAAARDALLQQQQAIAASLAALEATPDREPPPSKYAEPARVEEPAKPEPVKAAHADDKKGK
jgi:hypothetical protein